MLALADQLQSAFFVVLMIMTFFAIVGLIVCAGALFFQVVGLIASRAARRERDTTREREIEDRLFGSRSGTVTNFGRWISDDDFEDREAS